ncbi:MAG: hypothetical protein ABIJ96_08950, partial [Elusimicrobiota bacterium]
MDTPARKEREVSVRITVSRREAVGLAALALVCLLTPDLNTESLTLTTYYPAPYGAYKELRATETAYLAYVPGGSATPAVGV